MTGTTQGGKQAAASRGHKSLSAAGKKGGEHRQASKTRGHSSSSQASKKSDGRSRKDSNSE
ncbi:Uncharacterised protein [Legionella busanensis]|uniref:Stress-induced bacterial acidophilic repeat motif n=1 Tax=Legionella busanensis TaxID=190655 RepID=A0A378JQX0_9GAMM|nr:hypothetical protein [Legionella busanensis]STX52653.1 Uncharacterised protein [Legionella busanensis]